MEVMGRMTAAPQAAHSIPSVSQGELRAATQRALKRANVTEAEVRRQGKTGRFTNSRTQMAWMLVRDLDE